MFKAKTKSRLNRTLSGALALAMTASVAAVMPAAAEETAKYPYAVFAADEDAGITVNTDSFTLNGSAYTNGVFGATAQYPNINGTVTDYDDIEDNTEGEETEDVFDVSKDMILIHTKLTNKYFTENCDTYDDGYEALTLGTDPTKPDTDDNGVLDCDEDFDEDGLTNLQEYEQGTEPYNEDTDGDGLKDGEEINTYGTDPLNVDTDEDGLEDGDEIYFETDPLNPDSDGNGIPDGDEKRFQTFIHEVENEDCAVTEVRVSMEGTGNLQKTTTVESIMNKDILCTDVVGLVGEPFSIETTSQFDKATLTYVIDKSKLGDTEFDNLLFLWYDEENDNFVELDTVLDEKNSTVSVETTHFSKYMLVDQVEWLKAWKNASLYFEDTYEPLATVICYDCSGSMGSNDRTFNYNIFNDDGTIAYSYPTCYRKLAIDNFIDSMMLTDKTALVSFEDYATLVSGFSSDNDVLKSLVKPYNDGGTNAKAALNIAINQFETVEHWYSRHVILLSDGDVNITADQILQAKTAGIKIHTIGLGWGANNQKLQSCARDTGGQFFAAKTAEELNAIYSDLSKANHFDLEGLPDEDEDGLPDEFEVSGLVISNAQVVYTDPENPDCDDDGLLDGEEITSVNPKITVKENLERQETYNCVVFSYCSNPNLKDTDKDGVEDWDEIREERSMFNNWAFVFYDNNEFSRQGIDESKYLKEQNSDLTVRTLSVTSKEDFLNYWDLYCDIGADVSLVFHGSPINIWLVDDQVLVDDIKYLKKADINNFRILACNCGHKDVENNIANNFKNHHNINHLYAMDGNISYYPSIVGSLGFGNYNPRLSTTQVGFHEYASKVKEFAGPNVGYIEVYRKPTGLYEVI